MNHWPIRVQLTVRYFLFFSAAALLLVFSSWLLLKKSLVSTAQSELEERTEDLAGFLRRQPQDATLEQTRIALKREYAGRDEGKYLLIIDQSGEWLYFSQRRSIATPMLPLPPRSPGVTPDFHRPAPMLQSFACTIQVDGSTYGVATGLSFRRSQVLLHLFARSLLLLTPVLLILAALAGHLLSRKALAPVAAISAEARRINETNLSVRLPLLETRDELQDLSETLNQMLARIDTAFGSVRAFTANASHELRTPLSLIRTRVEIALCFPRSAEYYKTTLEQVQATTVHMTALLESLLTLARADANVETISLTPVSLDLLVMEAADHWRPFTQRQGLTLSIVGNGAPRWVMGDITALRRCTAILMENACRYTESGTVEIGLEAEPGFVTLLVKDTGIGIAPQHMPHLFERFYRGNGARRANGFGEGEPHRAKNGSGLGLSLAKWIVDQHHAELLVESRLGAGSCFRIRLPACATTANASATSEAQILRAIE
jgi:signal transduction histidine kinase